MSAWLLLPWAVIPLALRARARSVRTRTDGPALNGALARTGVLQLVFCLLFAGGDPRERRDRLMKLELERRTLQARAARCETSYGAVGERELVLVALTDEDGVRRLRRSGAAGALRRREHGARAAALERYAPGAGAHPRA